VSASAALIEITAGVGTPDRVVAQTAAGFGTIVAPPGAEPAQFSQQPSAGVIGYAFAKASPLLVFDGPALTNGRKEDFEFGTAYEVIEQTSDYVKLRRPGQREAAYVRLSHVSVVPPRWIVATDAFNRPERPRIRFWESSAKLNNFLSGINTVASPWDYEEYFESPPKFPLKLPVLGTDTLDLLGGDRQTKIVSVMLPISREMFETFEKVKAGTESQLDLYFLLDVSGSTKGFLEPAIAAIAKALGRNETLRKRIGTVVVTTFGASRTNKASLLGGIPLDKLERVTTWHPQGLDQVTDGDREPLLDGLLVMATGTKPGAGAMGVLVVLSGADVELSGYVAAASKSMAIENVDLKLPNPAIAVLGQVTPEPGDELRDAGKRLKGLSSARYVEFSETLGEDVVGELVRAIEGRKDVAISPEAFAPVTKASYQKQMMAFLPRVLTANSSFPSRQSYAAQADWYTVPLWLTFDQLLWKETTK